MLKTLSFKQLFLCSLFFFAIFIFGFNKTQAQSQALNGQIEGVVTDSTGAVVPNASITVRNVEKGNELQVTSDQSGIYRAPLLPLGLYRVTVESPNFKRLVREGITLSAGQVATVNLSLEAGDVSATVTVTSDAPIADPGKIAVGRVINTREIENLPLVSRNPYNYALLQANVTGRPNNEFGVPRVNANGYARRTNYQLDGNANTQVDRAGIRLIPISETFVSEVQLVTNGFSAEFGNTPGLIMNTITPSGTNGFHGSASYRFRRTAFSSRPFGLDPSDPKPGTKVDDVTVAVGGPIIKDRWHFYGGYEYVNRDLSGNPAQVINISAANRQRLITEGGVSSSIFPAVIPASQKVNFYIFRTDAQLTDAHRLSGRYIQFTNLSPNNIAGNLNTVERSIDFDDFSNSTAIQLASVISPEIFNEFRFQYSKRESQFLPNALSGTGPSIVISNVANFGSPVNQNTVSPLETQTGFQNNLTLARGDHAIKVGGGANRIYDFRRSNVQATYTFANIDRFLEAVRGTNLRSYSNYVESFGDPELEYKSTFYNLFAQDDWKATRRLKVSYGLRYDLYKIPEADPNSPFATSQDFKVDKNNFAPRLGVVYALREGNRPTVVRASTGIYYDIPYLDVYQRALRNNGSPQFFNFSFGPTTAGAPTFPNTLSTLPAGSTLPRQSLETVSPDFETMYAIHYQAQLEQAITNDLSFTVGYIHSDGRHIPVYANINCIATGATLADGRPIFGTKTVNATTGAVTVAPCVNRINTQFQNILQVDSGGNSTYDAGTFQLSKRFSQGYQFDINYTLSRARDDAPEQNLVAVTSSTLSSPFDRAFDRGFAVADQRHTFVMSFVGRPTFDSDNKVFNYILNNNQLGVIATANSGETFNIIANSDLNGDGQLNDRPVGFERNSGRTPKQVNVDLRYSRFIPITERFRIELFAEATNIFNINSLIAFSGTTLPGNNVNTSLINPLTGELRGSLPNFTVGTSQDSRQGQFGIKFIF